MTKHSGQRGHYRIKDGFWRLHYRTRVIENGVERIAQRAHRLGSVADFPAKRHKAKGDKHGVPNEIRSLGDAFLASINLQTSRLQAMPRLGDFIDEVYMPFVKAQHKPSTVASTASLYATHLKPRTSIMEVWLRDVLPHDVQNWLETIAREDRTDDGQPLTSATLQHIKAFISGVFRRAIQLGYLSGVNPVRSTTTPKGRASNPTAFYTLDESRAIIAALPRPASVICAVAAFAGLRKSEIRGLRFEDYDIANGTLRVSQSVWGSHIGTPKTAASQGLVPVIPELRRHLDMWRLERGAPTTGLMFTNGNGTPIELNNLLNRVIAPALKAAKLDWKGFHSWRRGIATALNAAGVADITIQGILRHDDIATTRASYIKTLPPQLRDAMQQGIQRQIDATNTVDAVTVPPANVTRIQ